MCEAQMTPLWSTSKCMTGAMKPSMTCEKVYCPFFFL